MTDTETRRTIPQIRKAMRDMIDALEADVEAPPREWLNGMRVLIEETKRRKPATRVASVRHLDPDPAVILQIREYKEVFPEMPYTEIAHAVGTSIRCVSFAIAGRRDGSPVYSEDGRRAPRRAKKSPEAPEQPHVACSCSNRMGNDFYFLPTGECLRPDKVCDGGMPGASVARSGPVQCVTS